MADILLELGWNRRKLADRLGVPRSHFDNVCRGVVHPNETLRTELPKLLGRAEDELFTAAALAKPYDPKHNWRKKVSR
ncbi:hypothetical protein [Micromonospora arida]